MSLANEEEAIRDIIFNNPSEGGILKREYDKRKETDCIQEKRREESPNLW